MDELTVPEWKSFLGARITQENGDDGKALEIFDELLKLHPTNPHLLGARAFALQRLGRKEDAIAAQLESSYSELGKSLTGTRDVPEVWTARLKSLLEETEAPEALMAAGGATIAW